MIPDQLLRVADNQNIGGVGGVNGYTVATNVVDLDTVRNIGVGTTLYFRVRFDTTYVQSPAGGSNIAVYIGEDANLANGVLLAQIPFGSTAIPPAGSVYYIPIPPVSKDRLAIPGTGLKKYIGILWQSYTASSEISNAFWTVDIVTDVNMVENTYTKGFTVQ